MLPWNQTGKDNDRKQLDRPPRMIDIYGCLHEDIALPLNGTVQAVKVFTKYISKGFEKR